MVDHAACDGNQGIGMAAPYLPDGLTAFLVTGVGDGAGVHDKDVNVAVVVPDDVPSRLKP